jgi:hypothetical protein
MDLYFRFNFHCCPFIFFEDKVTNFLVKSKEPENDTPTLAIMHRGLGPILETTCFNQADFLLRKIL